MDTTFDPRASGAQCDRCVLRGQRPVPGSGPLPSEFVVIGEAPGPNEEAQGAPFVGASGQMLNAALTRGGLPRHKVRVTNVLLCRPPGDGSLDKLLRELKASNKKAASAAKKQSAAWKRYEKAFATAWKRYEKAFAKWLETCSKQDTALAKAVQKVDTRNARVRTRCAKQGIEPDPETLEAYPSASPRPPQPQPNVPTTLDLIGNRSVAAVGAAVPTPMECCRPRLEAELKGARTLLLIGKQALQTLTGRESIMAEQGAAIELPATNGDRRWAVATIHPAAILRGLEQYRGAFYIWVANAIRLHQQGGSTWKDPAPFYTSWRVVLVLREAVRLANERRRRGDEPLPMAVDIESDGLDPAFSKIRCIGFAFGETVAVAGLYSCDGRKLVTPALEGAVRSVLTHPWIRKVFHNGIFDRAMLGAHGFRVEGPGGDTLLAHHAIESEVPHRLDFLSSILLPDAPAWKSLGDGTHGLTVEDDRQLWRYNGIDAYRTLRLYEPLMRVVETDSVQAIYEQSVALQPIFAEMQATGLLLDPVRQNEIRTRLVRERVRCEAEMVAALDVARKLASPPELAEFDGAIEGEPFGYNRPAHREAALILLGAAEYLPRTEKTGNRSTAADDLIRNMPLMPELARKYIGHKLGGDAPGAGYLGATSATKAISTFCDAEPSPDGRVRASWSQHTTPTGRLACSDPNLQNIPQWLRAMYRAPPGYKLVAVDYSALELWIIAVYAQAKGLLTALASADVHRLNCESLFGLSFADRLRQTANKGCPAHGELVDKAELVDKGKTFEVSWPGLVCDGCRESAQSAYALELRTLKNLRTQAKRFVYAANYQALESTIWMKLLPEFPGLQLQDVCALGAAWKKVNPEIPAIAHRNLDLFHRRRLKDGAGWLISPICGRRRYWTGKEFGLSDAANYPIQSAGADIINMALLRLWPRAKRLGARLFEQGHDALGFEVPEAHAELLAEVLEEEMPGQYKFIGIDGLWSFPVETKIGDYWSEV